MSELPEIEVNRFGYTEAEHEEIAVRVDISHMRDYDGSRRLYADSVSTSQALKNRRLAHLTKTNGHSRT